MDCLYQTYALATPALASGFKIAAQSAVEILLGTDFIDRFIRGVFPSELKIVHWHSRPVATTPEPKTTNTARSTNLSAENPVSAAYQNKTEAFTVYDVVLVVK